MDWTLAQELRIMFTDIALAAQTVVGYTDTEAEELYHALKHGILA